MVKKNNPFVSILRAGLTIEKVGEGYGYLYTFDAYLFESTPWTLFFYPPEKDEYVTLDAIDKFELTGPDGKVYTGTILRMFDSGDHLPRYIEAQGRVRVFDTIHIGHFDEDGTAIMILFTVESKKEFVPGAHSAQIFVWKKDFFCSKV